MTSIQADISKIANKLGLSVFAHYDKYLKTTLPFEDNLLHMLKEQALVVENARISRKAKQAGFPVVKTLNTFEISIKRFPYLNINEFQELATCRFIEERADVAAIGPPGHGKTHAALAIGYEAIKRGYNVQFKRAVDLINQMNEAKTEKRLSAYEKNLNKCKLLIIDEVGYLPFDSTACSFLFQIISARYETASTFYTTNFEFSKWVEFIKDKRVIIPIVSRIAQHSIVLNMNGPMSWRLEHARSRDNELFHEL